MVSDTLRILVAEDDPDHRYLLTRALRQAAPVEVEIEEVGDGQQALERLRGEGEHAGTPPPHVVFLDLRMPGVGGLQVLEHLKGDTALAHIPVVVVSSSDRPDDIDAAYRLGTNSYVTKVQAGPLQTTLKRVADYWTVRSELPTA